MTKMQDNKLKSYLFMEKYEAIKSRLGAKIELRRPPGISSERSFPLSFRCKEFPDDEIPARAEIIEPSRQKKSVDSVTTRDRRLSSYIQG
jgi:hypothetical protein